MAGGKIYGTAYKPNGTKSGVYDVWLSWNSSVSDLTSTVNATLYVKRNDGYSNSAWNNFHQVWGRIYFNGNEVGRYDNLDIDTRKSKTATLCSATFSVKHSNGAEKKINLSASFGGVAVSGLDRGTVSSTEVSLGTISIYSHCTAPTWFSVSPNPFESKVKLSWGGASGGTNNSIKNYYIQYATSDDNSNWSGWSGLTTTEATKADISPQISRGKYIKYRIRTQGTAGESYYSGYKETSSIRRNSRPNPPTEIKTSLLSYVLGESITISWNEAKDIDNNITAYSLESRNSADGSNWGEWTSLTEKTNKLSYKFTPSASFLQNQSFVQFRVYSEDLLGAISSKAIVSEAVQRDDNTGVRFGIGGKYKKTYLYVGNSGKWQEYDVYDGIYGKWSTV